MVIIIASFGKSASLSTVLFIFWVCLCSAVKENDGACGRWWNGIRAGGTDRPCDGKEGFAVSHIVIYCYGVVGRSSSFLVELFSFFFLGC